MYILKNNSNDKIKSNHANNGDTGAFHVEFHFKNTKLTTFFDFSWKTIYS